MALLHIYPPDNGQSRRRFRVNGPVSSTEGEANLTNVVQTEEGLSLLSKDTQFAQCLFCKYATLALILHSIPQIGSSSYLRVRWRCPSWRPHPPARASPSRPRAGDERHHYRRCYSSWRSSTPSVITDAQSIFPPLLSVAGLRNRTLLLTQEVNSLLSESLLSASVRALSPLGRSLLSHRRRTASLSSPLDLALKVLETDGRMD